MKTPSQCIPSVTWTSLILHLSAFLWYCFGVYHEAYHYRSPNFDSYGGRFKYFTVITEYLCIVVYGYSFLVDLLQITTGWLESTVTHANNGRLKDNQSIFIRLRDYLMTVWISTLSIFVVIAFWGIAAVDVEGIHPASHQKRVPLFGWFNHYLHTTPGIIAIILLTCVNYRYGSISRSTASILTFGLSYVVWMWHVAGVTGNWPYEFIDGLSREWWIAFVVVCLIVILMLDLLGRKISSIVWSEKRKREMERIRRKKN